MKIDTVMNYLWSTLLVGLGLKVIITKKFIGRGGLVDFSSPFLHWPIGLVLIVMGILLLFNSNQKD